MRVSGTDHNFSSASSYSYLLLQDELNMQRDNMQWTKAIDWPDIWMAIIGIGSVIIEVKVAEWCNDEIFAPLIVPSLRYRPFLKRRYSSCRPSYVHPFPLSVLFQGDRKSVNVHPSQIDWIVVKMILLELFALVVWYNACLLIWIPVFTGSRRPKNVWGVPVL